MGLLFNDSTKYGEKQGTKLVRKEGHEIYGSSLGGIVDFNGLEGKEILLFGGGFKLLVSFKNICLQRRVKLNK